MAQRISCDLCESSDFSTYRYKCLNCDDFDLCGFCFERHTEIGNHKLSHLMLQFNSIKIFNIKEIDEHENLNLDELKEKFNNYTHKEKCVTCSKTIKNIKLKCDICYEYYQCIDCWKKGKTSKTHSFDQHPMIVCNEEAIKLDITKISVLKKVGSGGFGVVNLVNYEHKGKIYEMAVKKLSTINKEYTEQLTQSFFRELDAQIQIKGENILQMIGNSLTNNKLYIELHIATEYIPKGSLDHILSQDKNFGLFERFKVAFGMICGIDRMHKNEFVHRDIKPANVLITEDYCAKIADFGISKIIKENDTPTFGLATHAYTPAEFFKYKALKELGNEVEVSSEDLKKMDIFSYGLTILEIFYGNHGKKEPLKDYGSSNPIIIKKESKYFKKLTEKCVDLEPGKRPKSSQILDYLIVLNDFIQFLRNGELKQLELKTNEEKTEIMEESCILFENDYSI